MQFNDHITLTGQDDTNGSKGYTREQIIDLIQQVGLTYHSSICSKSTVLVASKDAIAKHTRKVQMASRQGVRIISYLQFFTELVNLERALAA